MDHLPPNPKDFNKWYNLWKDIYTGNMKASDNLSIASEISGVSFKK